MEKIQNVNKPNIQNLKSEIAEIRSELIETKNQLFGVLESFNKLKYPHLTSFSYKNGVLVEASLSNYNGTDLPDLPDTLEFLDIDGGELTNLNGIENLKELKELTISCGRIESLSGVEKLENLEKLDIDPHYEPLNEESHDILIDLDSEVYDYFMQTMGS